MTRVVLAFILATSGLAAHAEPLPTALLLDKEVIALRSAETIGRSIYRHDRAAAMASDAVVARNSSKPDSRVRGWVTEERVGAITVTFFDQTPAALYRATLSADDILGPVTALEPPAPLTDFESGAAAARATALASDFQRCSKTYNSVTLPASGASGKEWVVYLLPGTTKNNVVPLGGTYRMETNGAKITAQRGFTRSCITLQTPPGAVGLTITHLLDPIPTEAHVFWSLWARVPIFVITSPNGTSWTVEGSKIKLLERKP